MRFVNLFTGRGNIVVRVIDLFKLLGGKIVGRGVILVVRGWLRSLGLVIVIHFLCLSEFVLFDGGKSPLVRIYTL